jgi:3-hydroxy-9,10-secoandrosta-1,3,5(10)-triene-9,17-dione monooxygenase
MADTEITLESVVERAHALVPALRARAAAAEKARRMPDNTIADMMDAGIFRIHQPKRVGGYEFDYGPAQFEVAKALGRGCGSSAWVGVLIACHNWALGMFPPEAQDEVWGPSPDTLTGTAFAASNSEVREIDGGYQFSGRWQFASGIDHCTWVILGAPVMKAAGPPDYRWFLLPSSDYKVEDTWYAAGLRASGSNDVVVDDAFVPAHRSVSLSELHGGPSPGSAVNPGHIFQLPVMMVFAYNIGAPMVGTAEGCIEALIERTKGRVALVGRQPVASYPAVHMRLAESAAEIDCAGLLAERDAAEFNAIAKAGGEFPMAKRVLHKRNIAYGAMIATRAVDRAVQILGAQGVAEDSLEQRAFRDIHAMNAHIAVQWDINAVGYAEEALGLEITDKRL